MLTGARLRLVFLAALGALPHGCFPPVLTVVALAGWAAGPEALEVLGVALSIGVANLALGILCCLATCFSVCLVLAIYNTDSYLLTHHPATHNPTQYPTVYILPYPFLP